MLDAIHGLKKKMTEPTVLSFTNLDQAFSLQTDAFSVSIGAVLSLKKEDGKIHPLQCIGRTLTAAQRNYSASERETLAVIFVLKKCRLYLLFSIPFKVITEHMALQYEFQKRDVHGRSARWLDVLAEYVLEIAYRAGKENGAAEYPSRIVHGNKVEPFEEEGDTACMAVETDDFPVPEKYYADIARFMFRLLTDETDARLRHAIRRNAKTFLV